MWLAAGLLLSLQHSLLLLLLALLRPAAATLTNHTVDDGDGSIVYNPDAGWQGASCDS